MPREFQTSAKQRLIDEFAVFDQEKQETIWSGAAVGLRPIALRKKAQPANHQAREISPSLLIRQPAAPVTAKFIGMAEPMLETFMLFIQDEKGPMYRAGLNDLAEAKRLGREIAETEKVECFIYSFKEYREVERFYPPSQRVSPKKTRRKSP